MGQGNKCRVRYDEDGVETQRRPVQKVKREGVGRPKNVLQKGRVVSESQAIKDALAEAELEAAEEYALASRDYLDEGECTLDEYDEEDEA
jgi:hypothetical protein